MPIMYLSTTAQQWESHMPHWHASSENGAPQYRLQATWTDSLTLSHAPVLLSDPASLPTLGFSVWLLKTTTWSLLLVVQTDSP